MPTPTPDTTLVGNVTNDTGSLFWAGVFFLIFIGCVAWAAIHEWRNERRIGRDDRATRRRHGEPFHMGHGSIPEAIRVPSHTGREWAE